MGTISFSGNPEQGSGLIASTVSKVVGGDPYAHLSPEQKEALKSEADTAVAENTRMKKGGVVSASKRADGIAQRGKIGRAHV